ncbi:hypothetical protein [Saliterribacillus persicus]|uniref:Uncharacterized protein n=1 Tax=Saliterribacillus persicus TaxID=930114 RepID=A0A368XZ20_9BACI|nr:hypothetical protein [Saliterribacillus persicus]RCW73233.1 hypothetical protein DFR57_104231 [Saliterribacillus persicus]
MEVVLALVAVGISILVAVINLVTALLHFKRHNKKDRRSAKRRST